jgi:hypothetical protein
VNDLESIYRRHCEAGTAISAHLPRLRELAAGLDTVVEFGVKRGASSSALLLGAKRVVSFDVIATPEAKALKEVAGERWDYRIEDSRAADVPECDLMFVDSLHTYEQVRAEAVHADRARRYLVFHDVSTFGEVGAVGETGRQSWTYVAGRGSVPMQHRGIRPAIDELMIRDPSWRIIERRVESHGLLVLARD